MRSKDFILSILLAATSTACVTVAAQAAEGTVIQPELSDLGAGAGLAARCRDGRAVRQSRENRTLRGALQIPRRLRNPNAFAPDRRGSHGPVGQGAHGVWPEGRRGARKAARCGDVHHASGRRVASRVDRCGDRHRATFVWVVRSGTRKVAPHASGEALGPRSASRGDSQLAQQTTYTRQALQA